MSVQEESQSAPIVQQESGSPAPAAKTNDESVFAYSDKIWDKFVNRIGSFFSHTQRHRACHLFEPAFAGFFMALALFMVDAVSGQMDKSPLYSHFLTSSIDHIKPLFIYVALVALAFSFLAVGGPAGGLTRKVVAIPLLNLIHHFMLLAVGVLWAVSVIELCRLSFTWANAAQVFGISAVLAVAGYVILYVVDELRLSADNLEKDYKSFRFLLFILGIAMLVFSLFYAKKEATLMYEKHEAEHPSEKSAPAGGEPSKPDGGPTPQKH